ncbi:RtcB family protein, partial [Escherichia coli]|nr:RtcB family protein [Escherichia coli]
TLSISWSHYQIPMAYKDIDAVMAAQSDLVEVIYTLRQVVCVKG